MLTLQIQDRGSSFAFSLEDRPAIIGSGEGADLSLQSDGVKPRHARIEFLGGMPQLVALGGGTFVLNGRNVSRAPLREGDVVAIGEAQITVREVAAAVDSEPASAPVVPSSPRAPRPESKQSPRKSGTLLAVVAALLLAVGIVVVLSQGARPEAFAEIESLRRRGEFAQAHALLETLRKDWSAGDAAREAEVDAAEARVAKLQSAFEERRDRTREQAVDHTDAQVKFVLQREIENSEDETVQQAARMVLAAFPGILAGVERKPVPASKPPEPVATTPTIGDQLPAKPEAAPVPAIAGKETAKADAPKPQGSGAQGAMLDASDIAAAVADADRYAGQGRFNQALDTLKTAIASASESDVKPLRTKLADVTATARQACDKVVAAAREQQKAGKVTEALAQLEAVAGNFPAGGDYAPLAQACIELRNAQTAAERGGRKGANGAPVVDEATRQVTLQMLREQLDKIRTAEAAGDFAACETLLRQGAEMAKSRDADFAARMVIRADEFAVLKELHEAVAALLQKGQRFPLSLRSGVAGDLHAIEGSSLLVTVSGAEQRFTWPEVTAPGLGQLALAAKLSGKSVLGAAALLYRNGESTEAEAILAKALEREPALKTDIDQAIARGRGEEYDARGYTLGKDGTFTSARSADSAREAQKILARLNAVLANKDKKAREAFTGEVLAMGASSLPAVTRALREQLQKQVEAIDRSPLKKQLDKLDAQRKLLDDARSFAKELIYDEVKYFYPYKPPQVSSDRYAEYVKVQAEVDRRVDAVRVLWGDDRIKIKVPAKIAEDLERLDWLSASLSSLGDMDPAALAEVEWARALPAGDTITARNYCRTREEREELELWARVEAYNEALRKTEKSISVVEFELLAVTNDYRAMFRHRPLAAQLNICAAAHGHADEMSKLGYFSHFSPTPGRRTPFDRMKLAGYDSGASENIALTDSAVSAHYAWLHSSGHHRNLLDPHHTEIGLGGIGRYWVQNFGGGKSYQDHAAWKSVAAKKP